LKQLLVARLYFVVEVAWGGEELGFSGIGEGSE
jgi:hypothetical protein